MSDAVRLVEIRDVDLDQAAITAVVQDPAAGGFAVYVGTVRDNDNDKNVTGLQYSAHPSAEAKMREICERIATQHDVIRVAAVHRVGDLPIGGVAVVVAVSTGHRGEAFAACKDLIDTLKAETPIWKHQIFADGSTEWVGTP
ncbi:molybdenum cofactor biosynthesis protein MoaE [Sporichthya sp.]|uniref:molybdenum cofactor biosynthesis protein MoaE n=1 Tax=Sporichthya sp. TaxID=65475 RepID=UPI0018207568|nr:molybdenum cofactor biosynthesis protein MoaE [Sporichthya sp.]MBA3741402.1 molybdenum cofactor biosynthesis protein MoaE [Sporichthya sp.]